MIRGEWSVVLEEQARAFADYQGERGDRYLAGFFGDVQKKRPFSYQHELDVARAIPLMLFGAEPIFVTSEMTDLVQAAGETLPSEKLQSEDVPIRMGFAYFASPLWMTDAHHKRCAVAAVSWCPMAVRDGEGGEDGGENRPGVAVAFYSDLLRDEDDYSDGRLDDPIYRDALAQQLPKLTMLHCGAIEFGDETRPSERPTGEPVTDETPLPSMMLALWRLMEQRIAVVETHEVDRATRRRVARIHPEYDRPVRVVTLRRPRRPADEGVVQSSVEWSHRWVTRGHWRNQWYPSRGVYRHIWIAPYIKGPDDKPLELPVDRVFRLAR